MTEPRVAPFYEELMDVIAEVNLARQRTGEAPVTFRSAVVQGMGLRDSFTSKIKSGVYRPTLERCETLATFLQVAPARLPTFRERYSTALIHENPKAIEFMGLLASYPAVADLLLEGAIGKVKGILAQASLPKQIAA